jgi:hypothetical protein
MLIFLVLFVLSKLFLCVKFNFVLELSVRIFLIFNFNALGLDALQLSVLFKHLSECKLGTGSPSLVRVLLELNIQEAFIL